MADVAFDIRFLKQCGTPQGMYVHPWSTTGGRYNPVEMRPHASLMTKVREGEPLKLSLEGNTHISYRVKLTHIQGGREVFWEGILPPRIGLKFDLPLPEPEVGKREYVRLHAWEVGQESPFPICDIGIKIVSA
jgi:hypothetical protein